LLADDAPFVELPIGTTEDRLVGSIDLAAALTGGEVRFSPGLLAAAHGGVLYVDEVNRLPDHLVDVLLDVAVSGVNRVEREGVSHTHPSRFVLIGSRGRFPTSWSTPSASCACPWAPKALRADLVICRAAAALAGLEGRGTTTVEDVHPATRSRKWMDQGEALKEGTAGDPADRMRPAVGADVVERSTAEELLGRLRPRQRIPETHGLAVAAGAACPTSSRSTPSPPRPPPWSMPSSPPWASRNHRQREGTPA